MNTKEEIKAFENAIREKVEYFIANEEEFTDNVQLEINTTTFELEIADPDNDLPECDYYPMMDLVKMSAENPGKWEADDEAIAEVVADYVTE